jgi:hypothetical protein
MALHLVANPKTGVSGPSGHHDSLGQTLLQGRQLFLCSDGRAKDHNGSFGWVIVTSTQMLWECSGIATGWFANSFRSEGGVGQLSLLVFFEAYIPLPRVTGSLNT